LFFFNSRGSSNNDRTELQLDAAAEPHDYGDAELPRCRQRS